MRFDLHLHTTASDGHLTPEALVAAASQASLHAIAVTDHDTVESLVPVRLAARDTGITVIPGVELSATHEGRDVHILGYFIRPDDATFLARMRRLRDARLERAGRMVESLSASGLTLSIDEVLQIADGGAVGRSHVARALVAAGHTQDVSAAFRDLIGRGRPHYVSKPVSNPKDVIAMIADAGGISVLAHPGVTQVDDLIPGLIDAGLGGIEAFHGDHSPVQREQYARLANDRGLLVTGGSDYHGPGTPGVALGEVDMPDMVLERLLQAGERLESAR